MEEAQEIKKRKEDYRVEIRKNKQNKTFQANRARLANRLFEEEITSSTGNGFSIEPFTYTPTIENKSMNSMTSESIKQGNSLSVGNPIFQQQIINKNTSIISNSENLEANLLKFIEDTRTLEQQWISGINDDLLVANQILGSYGTIFKEISEKDAPLLEISQIHRRLFDHLQAIIRYKEKQLQNNEQLAETLLSKVFQYLVKTCLHSETILNDCFLLNMIDYFINVMISQSFLQKKSNIIIYSVTLIDHIAARGVEAHLTALSSKEVVRQVLSIMNDITVSLPLNHNSDSSLDIFNVKVLVHLSNILSNLSLYKDSFQVALKSNALEACEKLLMWTSTELNERNKGVKPKQIGSFGQNMGDLETQGTPLSNEGSSSSVGSQLFAQLNSQSLSLRAHEDLEQIEINLGACILNLLEFMESEEMDLYLGEHVSFIVFVEQQIIPSSLHVSENWARILIYADIINGLLQGDKDQIDLVIETYEIIDYLVHLVYSPFPKLISAGLACYYNILISAQREQFNNILESDPEIIGRLLEIIQNYGGNTQLTGDAFQTLAECVDSAGKKMIKKTLRNSNIMSIIIMKMDPDQDLRIIKAALCLLESLFLSDKNSDDESDIEDEEMGEDEEENEQCEEEEDEEDEFFWVRKFEQNPAGNQAITRLFSSSNQNDIIMKLDQIMEDYLSN